MHARRRKRARPPAWPPASAFWSSTTTPASGPLRVVLGAEGFEVIEAGDGREGLEPGPSRIARSRPLDISMPVLDGFALAAALRHNERREPPPARLPDRGDRAGSSSTRRRAGAVGFFTKPFDPRAIARARPATLLDAATRNEQCRRQAGTL